jgi:hypothetical protein
LIGEENAIEKVYSMAIESLDPVVLESLENILMQLSQTRELMWHPNVKITESYVCPIHGDLGEEFCPKC